MTNFFDSKSWSFSSDKFYLFGRDFLQLKHNSLSAQEMHLILAPWHFQKSSTPSGTMCPLRAPAYKSSWRSLSSVYVRKIDLG